MYDDDDRVVRGHKGGRIWGGGVPLSSTPVPPPQNFFLNFAPGNGAFWCTFYAIFYSQLA